MRYTAGLAALFAAVCAVAAEAPPDAAKLKAAVKKEADGYFTIRHSGYVIKTDIDEQFAADAAVYLREFYETFRSFFKPPPKLKTTPVVYFFKDRAAYQDAVKKRGYDVLVSAGGAYAGSRTKSELFCFHAKPGTGFAGFSTNIVRHEGAHQLLSYILGTHDIPIWYNEGVATFFESWEMGKTREWNVANLQDTHTRFAQIARTYGTKDFVGLNDLMKLNDKTWVPDKFGAKTVQHYAEVQSFMTFLLVTEKGRKFFAELFREIAAGHDPEQILSRKTIDSAEKAWYKDIEDRIERAKKPKPEPAEAAK